MSNFEPFQSLTQYENIPGQIHVHFHSVSSPIYETTMSKSHSSVYFESLMFSYIEYIHRTKNLGKFKRFQVLFEDCLQNIQKKLFPSKADVKKVTNYASFDDLRKDLLHNLRSYEILFADKNHAQFSLFDLAKTKRMSQTRFHLILKFMLLDTLDKIHDMEEDNLKILYDSILEENFDEGSCFINMVMAYILDINIKIYHYETPISTVELFKAHKSKDSIKKRINLMKDKEGLYRLLSTQTMETIEEKEELIDSYEQEKTELLNQIECYRINQYNLEREVKLLRELYKNSLNMSSCLARGCQNYVDILANPQQNQDQSFKFSTRKELRETYRNIKRYEKVMRKKNLPHLDNRKHLLEIQEILENLQNTLGNIYERYTKPSFIEQDKSELEDFPIEEDEDFPPKNQKKEAISIPKGKDFDVGEIVPASQTFILCPICFADKPINEIRTFDCDCKICTICLTGWLGSRYEAGHYELDIPCFNYDCKSRKPGVFPPVSQHLVKELLGKTILEKMEMFLVFKFANHKCSNPDCSLRFELKEEKFEGGFVVCEMCRTATCVQCWNKHHPQKQCTRIDQSLKIAYANKMLRICPRCLEPATKDEACDKVVCKCGMEFCFSCSVVRAPTIKHGNYYHRMDCPFYRPYKDKDGNDIYDDKFDKSCSECAKAGKLCDRPNMTTEQFYHANKVDQFIIDSLKAKECDGDSKDKKH